MADLIKDGIAWLDARKAESLAQPITYVRDGYSDLPIGATMGRTTYEVIDEFGRTSSASSVDFLISAALISWTIGVASLPRIGDRIKVTEGTVTRTFEVLDLTGEGHYRWSDPRGVILRVHTKLIETT
jgi:hypothetical protein